MTALIQPTMLNLKRTLADPNTAIDLIDLIARKDPNKHKHGKAKKVLKGGVIAGIVIGIIVALIVLALIVFLLLKQRKRKQRQMILPADGARV